VVVGERGRASAVRRYAQGVAAAVGDIGKVRAGDVATDEGARPQRLRLPLTVAKDGRVRIDDQVWDDKEFSKHTTKMSTLEADLDKLIEIIKPVPFDWNNSWQDMYHRSSMRIPLALAQAHGLSPYDGTPLKSDGSDVQS
jgi:hypothetical protein